MKKANHHIAKRLHIKGLVQGVGFRPFIYRLAHAHGIFGWVENRNDGVVVKVEGAPDQLEHFIADISNKAPLASNIQDIRVELAAAEGFDEFVIVKSENTSEQITDVSPDIAVCEDCLLDLKKQSHRINYPFINCTNCGPRFSIIQDLPYDRDKTTMEPFRMCDTCRNEYEDVMDRRFHAQPVACSTCGPQYELVIENERITDFNIILEKVVALLKSGQIVAIKGIGGFQIACDAQNEEAVNMLRQRKFREGKPFAVMFADIDAVKDFTVLYSEEKKSLLSWRRPIVILREKEKLASGVSNGFHTIGAMLPYMPFHYLLFEKLGLPAIVLTSGNISDEPIVIDNTVAEEMLSQIADAVLIYNREIYNRTDDSVAMVVNNKERILRRSRGYSPEPVNLNLDVEGIVAAGAELVNCFCIGKGKQAILSQHIGDLKNLETLEFYEEAYHRFLKLFRVKPEIIVHDLHPDYLSTRFAKVQKLKLVGVQHHHAHVASCMAEHNLDEQVIGVSLDGTGFGTDRHIWGSEIFICDLAGYERYNHFEYVPLPGGDRVTKEPWRTGLSYLYMVYGHDFWDLDIPFVKTLDKAKCEYILEAIDKKINSPMSCSAGRLFDAVSAIMNICTITQFHAEAPMRLEDLASGTVEAAYPFEFGEVISFQPTIRDIVQDLLDGVPLEEISARFHNTVMNAVFAVVSLARTQRDISKVVLTGGTFQNRFLLSRLEKLLESVGFMVYTQNKIPSNDGGIALGQLAIAAKLRSIGKTYQKSQIVNH
ncbi:MAG: carbamoyltransferase HypF [Bacteroidetes bacterium]|nr:carbamoyltransferase HypF [Bacteroidota bacterium]